MPDKDDDGMLTDLFAAAQRRAPVPSDQFMERVLTDASKAQVSPGRVQSASMKPFWARIAALLGGWQGLGGLVTATAAGLWIGYAGMADPGTLTGGLLGVDQAVELMPGADYFTLAAGTE